MYSPESRKPRNTQVGSSDATTWNAEGTDGRSKDQNLISHCQILQ